MNNGKLKTTMKGGISLQLTGGKKVIKKKDENKSTKKKTTDEKIFKKKSTTGGRPRSNTSKYGMKGAGNCSYNNHSFIKYDGMYLCMVCGQSFYNNNTTRLNAVKLKDLQNKFYNEICNNYNNNNLTKMLYDEKCDKPWGSGHNFVKLDEMDFCISCGKSEFANIKLPEKDLPEYRKKYINEICKKIKNNNMNVGENNNNNISNNNNSICPKNPSQKHEYKTYPNGTAFPPRKCKHCGILTPKQRCIHSTKNNKDHSYYYNGDFYTDETVCYKCAKIDPKDVQGQNKYVTNNNKFKRFQEKYNDSKKKRWF